jgi:hypothetical protein
MIIDGISFTKGQLWLAGVTGPLILLLIRQWFTVHNNRRNTLRTSVHTFKFAFSDCASAIANDYFAIDTFTSDFEKHLSAVDTIRPILPKCYQRKLQKAWDEYCGKSNNLGFDDKGFVEATSATVNHPDRALFADFIKRFNALHGCLDDLL